MTVPSHLLEVGDKVRLRDGRTFVIEDACISTFVTDEDTGEVVGPFNENIIMGGGIITDASEVVAIITD